MITLILPVLPAAWQLELSSRESNGPYFDHQRVPNRHPSIHHSYRRGILDPLGLERDLPELRTLALDPWTTPDPI